METTTKKPILKLKPLTPMEVNETGTTKKPIMKLKTNTLNTFKVNRIESPNKVTDEIKENDPPTEVSTKINDVKPPITPIIEVKNLGSPKKFSTESAKTETTDFSSSSLITKLTGKKVLILDVETTGFPERLPGFHMGKDGYFDYKLLSKYDSSRIVSIASYYAENFDVKKINYDDIQYFVRKPTDFKITDKSEATKIHKITQEKALQTGQDFETIVKCHLDNSLKNCEYIIAHNAFFDVNIMLSELYRVHSYEHMTCVSKICDENKVLCTGELGRDICKLPCKARGIKYKMPKLCELYEHLYGSSPEKLHDARADVITLLKILALL